MSLHNSFILEYVFVSSFFVAFIIDDLFQNKYKRIIFVPATLMFIYALSIIIFNPTRPFIANSATNKIKIGDNRFAKYCANYSGYAEDYKLAHSYLQKYQDKVGVELGGDMWEYVLYHDIFSTNAKLGSPIHIENISKNIQKEVDPDFRFIISYKNDSTYLWNNSHYKKIKHLKLFSIYSK